MLGKLCLKITPKPTGLKITPILTPNHKEERCITLKNILDLDRLKLDVVKQQHCTVYLQIKRKLYKL